MHSMLVKVMEYRECLGHGKVLYIIINKCNTM